MKVILDARLLATAYEKRGIGEYAKGVLRHLPVVAPDMEFVIFLADKSHICFLPDLPNISWSLIKRSWRHPFMEDIFKLPGEIKKTGAHLYHALAALGPLRNINLPYWSPVPVVATVHDLHIEILDDPYLVSCRKEWRYKVQRRAAERAYLVADSTYTAQTLVEHDLLGRSEPVVVPLGCDEPIVPESVEKDNMVLFIGDAPHKNVASVVQVFCMLSVRLPDWRFVMVGSKSRIRGLAQGYADDLLTSGKLVIREEPDETEMRELYERSRLLFMPSLSEGFGF
ncbi:MAG: hypothetical protein A2293_15835, partial [Elusimicrobia bacterium RIFOXYB2_FULL_49_7]